jgi:predicted phosphoribosyltransferase
LSRSAGSGGYYLDRRDAGARLAANLREYAGDEGAIVLALPRGGVPVGYEIAVALGLTLDVLEVRKLGVPGQPELAMGAIVSGGAISLNEEVVSALRIPAQLIDAVARREERELERRETLFRDGGERPHVAGKTVILVDDGLATGATMRASIQALRKRFPRRIVVAVPVAPAPTCAELRTFADEVVCLLTPAAFYAVGSWYEDFRQVDDDEVRDLLRRARQREPDSTRDGEGGA